MILRFGMLTTFNKKLPPRVILETEAGVFTKKIEIPGSHRAE